MKLSGRAHIFGNNINTDEIIPAKFLKTLDRTELGKHCMEGIDENFMMKLAKGDIIVAGQNFGCGSSREQAPISIKAAGVSCVIAKSFARIFFRNSINIGLAILEIKGKLNIKSGDKLEIDLKKGLLLNKTTNKSHKASVFPQFLEELIKSGGLIDWVKKNSKDCAKK